MIVTERISPLEQEYNRAEAKAKGIRKQALKAMGSSDLQMYRALMLEYVKALEQQDRLLYTLVQLNG